MTSGTKTIKASEGTDLKIYLLLSIVLVIMDRSTLVQIPGEYQDIYKGSWSTIKTSIKQGRLKDVYHFPILTNDNGEILSKGEEVVAKYNEKFKVNVAFGFILKDRTTDELKFFHPSNNTMLFKLPRLLETPSDYRQFVEDIEQQDAFEYARLHRPSTKWTVERTVCVRFDIYRFKLRP